MPELRLDRGDRQAAMATALEDCARPPDDLLKLYKKLLKKIGVDLDDDSAAVLKFKRIVSGEVFPRHGGGFVVPARDCSS